MTVGGLVDTVFRFNRLCECHLYTAPRNMSTKPEWEWGADMNKAAALEEMYLIYQAVRNYLADSEPWGEFGMEDLVASYRSFCQREPLGGMFLESVLEELLEQARGCSWRYN